MRPEPSLPLRQRLRSAAARCRPAAPIAVAALAATAVGYLAHVDPNRPGHYPTCPFLLVTGYYCPGCGSLRMLHALAHGDVAEAASFNLLALAVLPLLVFWYLRWTARVWRLRPEPARMARPAGPWSLAVAVAAFWLLRNLPPTDFLAPGGW